MEPETTSILKEINAKLDAIQRSTAVLADIVDYNIGIERIWPKRRTWANDPIAGITVWKERVCRAKSVDIVANTLWTSWFHDDDLRREFFESLARKTTARILIYDPDSDILKLRARDEVDPKGQMQVEINSTLEKIALDRESHNGAAKKNLQVRLTTRSYHLTQIIRADDRMLVAIYLSGKTGSPSPTFQVRGPETVYFQIYQDQVNILWNRGREVSEEEWQRIAARNQGASQQVDLARLRQLLLEHFDDSELRDLCFDLNIEYDRLPGEGKGNKVRELVTYCARHGRVPELAEKCYELTPNVSWWSMS